MSYRVYRTHAFVLKSYPHREADKTLVLYTQDFGLVYARAQGVRLERSKLRYATSDLALSQVALVRGKAGWRLTGAVAMHAPPEQKEQLLACARLAALTSRMVGGEEENAVLFDTLAHAHEQLRTEADAELVEVLAVSRILHSLGYIAPQSADGALFSPEYYETPVESMREHVSRLLSRVNTALAAAQL